MIKDRDPEIIGDVGESAVRTMLLRFGWNVWPTNNRDRGTDLIVLTKGIDWPMAFGVQVRSGQSYFASSEYDANGDLLGWWHADTSNRFEYWNNHTLPHILVLYDDAEGVGYWVHITTEKVRSTGKGRKILVPTNQTIEESHREGLLAVTQGRFHTPKLEGTAFWAAAANIAPEQQLRYALLAPRLVAPHVNTGHGNPVSAVEAVALLAHGRFRDLAAIAENHPTVPDPTEEPPEGSDWAWSLVAAFWNWALTDRIDQLGAVYNSAPRGADEAASGVLLACALQRLRFHVHGIEPREGHAESITLLNEMVERSEFTPTDLGWVLVHRACCYSEADRDEDALADARAALENLTDGADVTATALAAAATATVWSIVATQDFEEADLGGVMTASDNAVSWWRSQIISGALTAAARTHFDAWVEKRFLLSPSGNVWDNKLFAAELNASLLGDHGTYRHIASLKARERMMSAVSAHDEIAELTEGLNSLRRSGDERSLEAAIAHLRRAGPIEAVVRFVNGISTDGWTRSTAAANLSALRLAGDLMDRALATELLLWIAQCVGGTGSAYIERLFKMAPIDPSVIGAASGLMCSADSSAHQAVAKMIGALTESPLDHPVSRLPDVIWLLDFDRVPHAERSALSELGWKGKGRVGIAALGWFAANDNLAALSELTKRAVGGDLGALKAIPVVALSDADAKPIIERIESLVQASLYSAREGTYSIGGLDYGGTLTQLNLQFPAVARWDPVVELLCEPRVFEADKYSPCSQIINSPNLLPERVRARFKANADFIGKGVNANGCTLDSGMGTAISIAIHATTGPDADEGLAGLAYGSIRQRQSAALVLGAGHQPNMQPVLLGLANDSDFEVRHETAHAVGKLVAANPSPEIANLAQHIAADEGIELQELLLVGLGRRNQALSGIGARIAQHLVDNPSARVRHRAQRLVSRHAIKRESTS